MARLQDDKFSKGLETIRALLMHPDFSDALGTSIRAEGGAKRAVDALVQEFDPSPRSVGVAVPDFEAKTLMEMIRNHGKDWLEIHPQYFDWDFFDGTPVLKTMRTGRGQLFRVEQWIPTRSLRIFQAVDQFRGNARGHVAAFVTWLVLARPKDGTYVCVPHEEACLRTEEGVMVVPFANVWKGKASLILPSTQTRLEAEHDPVFLAFSRFKMGELVDLRPKK